MGSVRDGSSVLFTWPTFQSSEESYWILPERGIVHPCACLGKKMLTRHGKKGTSLLIVKATINGLRFADGEPNSSHLIFPLILNTQMPSRRRGCCAHHRHSRMAPGHIPSLRRSRMSPTYLARVPPEDNHPHDASARTLRRTSLQLSFPANIQVE